jgi:hypothetical protein
MQTPVTNHPMADDFADLMKPDELDGPERYRATLIDLLHCLDVSIDNIFTEGVNVMMSGELAEQDAVFQPGDVYRFSPNHMENSTDQNVIEVLKLVNHMLEVHERIRNINAIRDDELEVE